MASYITSGSLSNIVTTGSTLLQDIDNFLTTGTANLIYAPINNPTFTGTLTAPTINASTALQVGGANINTIYAPLASPTFTGTATAPTINASTALQVGGVNINTLYAPLYPVQGQIQVSGTTPSITNTSGTSTITNVTRTSIGVYAVTWSPTINSSAYGVIGILRNQAGYLTYNGTIGTQMNINTYNTSGTLVDAGFSFYVFK